VISVVVVYNNEQNLNEILLKSLRNQTAKFELIKLDNTEGRFKSGAEALNFGGRKAKGKYIMFVHQDIELSSKSWLEQAEQFLDSIISLGVVGVAGMSEIGNTKEERKRGYISDCGEKWGKPFEKPEEVQTLDECLLIIPKSVFNKLSFDEKTFNNWHCYGVDYCLCAKGKGLKNYVIPLFVYHRSLRSNIRNLLKYQIRLYKKHNYKKIYVTTTPQELSLKKLLLQSVVNIALPIYHKVFPLWYNQLKKEINQDDTVLDLGCGYNSPIQYCNPKYSVGVEKFKPYLQESKRKGIHNKYVKADITKIEFKPKSFDVVLCSEVLEHLTKIDGTNLISKMNRWARKKVIMTTPNGFLEQNTFDDNVLQNHISGWDYDELRELGFKLYGKHGWKKLKGIKGALKYKPYFFWIVFSDMTQKVTYYFPKQAFQFLGVKQIKDTRLNHIFYMYQKNEEEDN